MSINGFDSIPLDSNQKTKEKSDKPSFEGCRLAFLYQYVKNIDSLTQFSYWISHILVNTTTYLRQLEVGSIDFNKNRPLL